MTLFYDNLVYSLQRYGGISTYWSELSQRMLQEQDLDIRFYETGHENTNICRSNLDIPASKIIHSNRAGLMVERFLKLPAHDAPNIFHSSYFRVPVKTGETRTVCTVHDFIHDLYFSGPRVWLHNMMKRRTVLQSDVIITVSEHTKRDLLRFYPKVKASSVKVIYNGVSDGFKILDATTIDAVRPYFLYVGVRDSYKNFDFAVQVAAAHPDMDLYMVGPPLSPKETMALNKALPGRYRIFTGVEDRVLNELYNAAFCLLYPSEYEGFGIPILEAMNAGCPFIALNKSAIPEVAGDAGVLLEGTDLDAGREAVRYIASHRAEVINKGKYQAAQFSWNACFDQTYQLYKSLQ